ncbi:MAG: purine-nucleoside phosphorylase [Propionivibrio sp.]
MNGMYGKLEETVTCVKRLTDLRPTIGVILGSGLGQLVERMTDTVAIDYRDLPHFPAPTVAGHAGRLVIGRIEGVPVMAMQGRFHYYEGHDMRTIAFPTAFMQRFGARTLIVSNAAGGINRGFTPGDLMLITDHLNLIGTNPLIGLNDERLGPRFPDMTEAYSPRLIALAEEAAAELGTSLRRGVYAGLSGPCYETAAEIRYLERIGADAVGMSTVPEVIVARYLGMEVLGISCVTNMATGIATVKHAHDEVVRIANEASTRFCTLVATTIGKIGVV